jgi:hypothetical protein
MQSFGTVAGVPVGIASSDEDSLPEDTKVKVAPVIEHLDNFRKEFQTAEPITPDEAQKIEQEKPSGVAVQTFAGPDGTSQLVKVIDADPDAVSAINRLQEMVAAHGDEISAAKSAQDPDDLRQQSG